MTNLPRASAIRETLQKLPDLEAAMRGRVVKALIGGGHAVDDLMSEHLYAAADSRRTTMSPIQASAANPRGFEEVRGLCRSLGFHISATDTKRIDVQALDAAFAGRDVDQRMRARFALWQIGLIPA
jgi:hypothetical protein